MKGVFLRHFFFLWYTINKKEVIHLKEFYQKNQKLTEDFLLFVGILVVSYIFFKYLFNFIAPFFFGWLLSLLFNPFVTFLEKKIRLPRWAGSLLSILLLIGFFYIVVAGIWNKLMTEAVLFAQNLPAYLKQLEISLTELQNSLPREIQKQIALSGNTLSSVFTSMVTANGGQSIKVLGAIPNGFMITIVSLISSYLFTKDKREISDFTYKKLSALQDGYQNAERELKNSIVAYCKTQLILMIYTFTICLIGLLILHSPYTLLLSVVISVIDAIPFFGSGFILWPGAAIHFLTGNHILSIGYLVIYVCVNLIRQIMQPKILGNQIGLHPLLTLVSMYVGLKAFGVLGMIIGPILAVLIKAFFHARKHLVQSNTP